MALSAATTPVNADANTAAQPTPSIAPSDAPKAKIIREHRESLARTDTYPTTGSDDASGNRQSRPPVLRSTFVSMIYAMHTPHGCSPEGQTSKSSRNDSAMAALPPQKDTSLPDAYEAALDAFAAIRNRTTIK